MNTNKHKYLRPFACPVGSANRTGAVTRFLIPISYF